MYCRVHNTLFLSEVGCHKCRVSWEDGPWETKEKEWLNKLDIIQEKSQKLVDYAAQLELDNKSLNRSTEHMTRTLGLERQAREESEVVVRRQETKLKAIGLGYRNALEREGDLQLQVEAVTLQRGEWMERCRLAEKTRCDDCGQDPCGCGKKIYR